VLAPGADKWHCGSADTDPWRSGSVHDLLV